MLLNSPLYIMLLFLGSTEDTRRILEFWLRLFCMETWEGEVVIEEDRGEETHLQDNQDVPHRRPCTFKMTSMRVRAA